MQSVEYVWLMAIRAKWQRNPNERRTNRWMRYVMREIAYEVCNLNAIHVEINALYVIIVCKF